MSSSLPTIDTQSSRTKASLGRIGCIQYCVVRRIRRQHIELNRAVTLSEPILLRPRRQIPGRG